MGLDLGQGCPPGSVMVPRARADCGLEPFACLYPRLQALKTLKNKNSNQDQLSSHSVSCNMYGAVGDSGVLMASAPPPPRGAYVLAGKMWHTQECLNATCSENRVLRYGLRQSFSSSSTIPPPEAEAQRGGEACPGHT